MSFSAVAPSTSVLNGYNDAGEAAATAQAQADVAAKKKTTATVKAATEKPDDWWAHGTGSYQQYTSTPTPSQLTADQILAQSGIIKDQTVNQHSADPIFLIVIPLMILVVIVWGGMKLIIWDIRRNPPYGGFSHKHKKHHPGKMNPRIFSSK